MQNRPILARRGNAIARYRCPVSGARSRRPFPGLAAVTVALMSLLSGCATQPPAPIDGLESGAPLSRPIRPPPPPVASVTVRRGDTLYAIAFARGLDFRDVARWNGISEPFTIYPGQVLRLGPSAPAGVEAQEAVASGPTVPREVRGPANAVGAASVQVVDRVPAPAAASSPRSGPPAFVPLDPPAAERTAPTPVATAAIQGTEPRPLSTGTAEVAAPAQSPQPVTDTSPTTPAIPPAALAPVTTTDDGTKSRAVVSEAPVKKAAPGQWLWPTDGKVLDTFGSGGRKGVVVGGRSGQAIRAARAGEVVYAGGGLLGYGLLVIIKHDETFLSAYGNNSRILVKEGARVEAGQSIAEMGASADGRVGLHFELRRKGQPIDPMTLVQAP
ncbi:MAG TPA: peptidase M23 [Gammaproteobacteria bacterium]|nr:peptidase M23 [Gammaproteobacteria bacterium]